MILATLDTSHFTFTALGQDAAGAAAAIEAGWKAHARQYGRAGSPLLSFKAITETHEIRFDKITVGGCLRDGSVIA